MPLMTPFASLSVKDLQGVAHILDGKPLRKGNETKAEALRRVEKLLQVEDDVELVVNNLPGLLHSHGFGDVSAKLVASIEDLRRAQSEQEAEAAAQLDDDASLCGEQTEASRFAMPSAAPTSNDPDRLDDEQDNAADQGEGDTTAQGEGEPDPAEVEPKVAAAQDRAARLTGRARRKAAEVKASQPHAIHVAKDKPAAPREGSKIRACFDLMAREGGATADELKEHFGNRSFSFRAKKFARKFGMDAKVEGGRYMLVPKGTAEPATTDA